jgi:hypothetical protein
VSVYLLTLALLMPAFAIPDDTLAGRRRPVVKCYLVKGFINGQIVFGHRYLTEDSADLLFDAGVRLERAEPVLCDREFKNSA